MAVASVERKLVETLTAKLEQLQQDFEVQKDALKNANDELVIAKRGQKDADRLASDRLIKNDYLERFSTLQRKRQEELMKEKWQWQQATLQLMCLSLVKRYRFNKLMRQQLLNMHTHAGLLMKALEKDLVGCELSPVETPKHIEKQHEVEAWSHHAQTLLDKRTCTNTKAVFDWCNQGRLVFRDCTERLETSRSQWKSLADSFMHRSSDLSEEARLLRQELENTLQRHRKQLAASRFVGNSEALAAERAMAMNKEEDEGGRITMDVNGEEFGPQVPLSVSLEWQRKYEELYVHAQHYYYANNVDDPGCKALSLQTLQQTKEEKDKAREERLQRALKGEEGQEGEGAQDPFHNNESVKAIVLAAGASNHAFISPSRRGEQQGRGIGNDGKGEVEPQTATHLQYSTHDGQNESEFTPKGYARAHYKERRPNLNKFNASPRTADSKVPSHRVHHTPGGGSKATSVKEGSTAHRNVGDAGERGVEAQRLIPTLFKTTHSASTATLDFVPNRPTTGGDPRPSVKHVSALRPKSAMSPERPSQRGGESPPGSYGSGPNFTTGYHSARDNNDSPNKKNNSNPIGRKGLSHAELTQTAIGLGGRQEPGYIPASTYEAAPVIQEGKAFAPLSSHPHVIPAVSMTPRSTFAQLASGRAIIHHQRGGGSGGGSFNTPPPSVYQRPPTQHERPAPQQPYYPNSYYPAVMQGETPGEEGAHENYSNVARKLRQPSAYAQPVLKSRNDTGLDYPQTHHSDSHIYEQTSTWRPSTAPGGGVLPHKTGVRRSRFTMYNTPLSQLDRKQKKNVENMLESRFSSSQNSQRGENNSSRNSGNGTNGINGSASFSNSTFYQKGHSRTASPKLLMQA